MIADRLSALKENQEKWKKRVDMEKTPDSVTKNGLSARKMALVQASDDWKKRVQADEEVNKLNSKNRLKNSGLIAGHGETPKSRLNNQKLPDELRNSTPLKILHEKSEKDESEKINGREKRDESLSPLDEVRSSPILITPRRNLPRAGKRLPTRVGPNKSSSESSPKTEPKTVITQQESIESNKENELYISTTPSCSTRVDRTPQIGVKNCGIDLKRVEYVNPYPELMLVQFKGSKFVDIRLVSPTFESVHPCATFLLITPKELFVYHGEFTSVLEKSRAAQMVCDIITGKEVLSAASKSENVQETPLAAHEFWRLLGGRVDSTEISPKIAELEQKLNEEGIGYEDLIKKSNNILRMAENEDIDIMVNGEIPRASILDSKEVLIFDFGTEVYVWIGRFSNRNLVRRAMKYAEQLKSSRPENCFLIRKLNEGLNDCLFRYKFPDWKNLSPKIDTPRWNASPLLISPPRKKVASPRVEESSKNDDELAENLSDHFAYKCHPSEHVLVLEDTELRTSDKNVFTEGLRFYKLIGESLEEMENLDEFFDKECYVIEWKYRVERIGIQRIKDGTPGREHETGRQRVAFFYWLGQKTTKKEQGLCALALRDKDKARHEHIRVEQGSEPPLLVNLFSGKFVVSSSENLENSKVLDNQVYIIKGSSQSLCVAEELEEENRCLREQAAYIVIQKREIRILKGALCGKEIYSGARRIAEHMVKIKNLKYMENEENVTNKLYVWLKSKNWVKAPRIYRIYETEGDEIHSVHWNKFANFTFQQQDLRDTMLVDQETHLWIWSETTPNTFCLKVASLYIRKKYPNSTIPSTVIYRTKEPTEFMALLPTWTPFEECENFEDFIPEDPQNLEELLEERTRYRSIEEVRHRNLPKGCDTKNLEDYLNNEDFLQVFKIQRNEYKNLPRWKQILLKKEANMF